MVLEENRLDTHLPVLWAPWTVRCDAQDGDTQNGDYYDEDFCELGKYEGEKKGVRETPMERIIHLFIYPRRASRERVLCYSE